MNKRLFTLPFVFGSLITPSIAQDANNFYLSIGGGLAFPSDIEGDQTLGGTTYDAKFETKNPGLLSIGLGKKFNDYRIEFNYSRASVESNKFTLTSGGTGVSASVTPNLKADVNSYMFYGYKDFTNQSKFTPYGGVGLGTAALSAKNQTVTAAGTAYNVYGAKTSVFSFGLKAGTDYEIAENTSLYAEGAYQNLASYKIRKEGFSDVNYDASHIFAITAGIKFNF